MLAPRRGRGTSNIIEIPGTVYELCGFAVLLFCCVAVFCLIVFFVVFMFCCFVVLFSYICVILFNDSSLFVFVFICLRRQLPAAYWVPEPIGFVDLYVFVYLCVYV